MNPTAYYLEGLVANELSGENFDNPGNSPAGYSTGDQLLAVYGMSYSHIV